MNLFTLLAQPPVQKRICVHLTFEEAWYLQKVIYPIFLSCEYTIQYNGSKIVLPGLTDLSFRIVQIFSQTPFQSLLVETVRIGDREMLQFFLEKIPDNNQPIRLERIEAFMMAIRLGKLELVDLFLNYVPVDIEFFGKAPLYEAINYKQLKIAELLLNHGANPNYQFINPYSSSLVISAANDHVEIIDLLVEKGVNLDQLDLAFIQTSSYLAWNSLNRLYELAQEFNIPLSLDRALLFVPIHLYRETTPINQGKEEVKKKNEPIIEFIRFLLEKGANVNVVDVSGNTVLQKAVISDYSQLISYLIQKGANLNFANSGHTILHEAVRRSNYDLIRNILSFDQVSQLISVRNPQGNTAFDIARFQNNSKMIDLLALYSF